MTRIGFQSDKEGSEAIKKVRNSKEAENEESMIVDVSRVERSLVQGTREQSVGCTYLRL